MQRLCWSQMWCSNNKGQCRARPHFLWGLSLSLDLLLENKDKGIYGAGLSMVAPSPHLFLFSLLPSDSSIYCILLAQMYARTCVCIYLETGVLLCCPGWSPIPGRKIISASVLGVAGPTGMCAPLLVRFAYFCCLLPSIMIAAPQGSVLDFCGTLRV